MNEDFVKMDSADYDKFMCKTFPELFRDRTKPMTETCMCWGFCIGPGWRETLYNLCKQLQLIYNATEVVTVFDQIKEKFGGARFYYHTVCEFTADKNPDYIKTVNDIIDDLVRTAERECDYICASSGEECQPKYKPSSGCRHGCSFKALLKNRPGSEELVEKYLNTMFFRDWLKQAVDSVSDNTIQKIQDLIYAETGSTPKSVDDYESLDDIDLRV